VQADDPEVLFAHLDKYQPKPPEMEEQQAEQEKKPIQEHVPETQKDRGIKLYASAHAAPGSSVSDTGTTRENPHPAIPRYALVAIVLVILGVIGTFLGTWAINALIRV